MTKLKKTRIKLWSAVGMLCLIMVISTIIGVEAYSNYAQEAPKIVMENVEIYNEAASELNTALGAATGPDIYSYLRVHGPFSYGTGLCATSTTVTTYTVVGGDLADYHMIDLMVNTGATTFTLPATSTMLSLLPDPGMSREWIFHNASSSTGITLTLVAGTGMDLVAVTANDDLIDPGEWTRLTCSQIYYRAADNENIMCIVDELTNAD